MAGNKFATMLHRNSHKMTVILVYAVLEWTLIIFLLLNSFFFYLISKFASYFGLKPPCLWCSSLDHILDPNHHTASYRHLVCEAHASEISRLSFCSNHKRLAEPESMCQACLPSLPDHTNGAIGLDPRIAFLSWVSHSHEDGDRVVCSCCNETLSSSEASPCFLLKPFSWEGLRYAKKGSLKMIMDGDDNSKEEDFKEQSKELDKNGCEIERVGEDVCDVESFSFREGGEDCSRSSQSDDKELVLNIADKHSNDDTKLSHQACGDGFMMQCCFREDSSIEVMDMKSQNYISYDDSNRLFPVELIDSFTAASQRSCNSEKEDLREHECQNETFEAEPEMETESNASGARIVSTGENEENLVSVGEPSDPTAAREDEEHLYDFTLGGDEAKSENFENDEANDHAEPQGGTSSVTDKENEHLDDFTLGGDEAKSENFENDEANDHAEPQEEPSSMTDNENGTENFGSKEANIEENQENVFGQDPKVETSSEEITTLADKSQEETDHHIPLGLDSNEIEEEKLPETPTSIEGLKKLQMFDKRENEESLDGSVISEMECGDSSLSIEHMKTALKAERKVLSAIYAELEEERSASAIAANQTMAMITRLQEEKAAMQMEALQYQRMMEEQSEYDQEALQLLNELMIKREKEKQELENELEIYRRKVLDYEARERLRMARTRSRESSVCGSQVEESDEPELSIDLNREAGEEEDGFYEQQEGDDSNIEMVLDCVKNIGACDVSLTEFEEEKQAILDQLKTLEEKLLTVGDEQFFEDLKSIENLASIKEFDDNYIDPSDERKSLGSMVKSLLPLLDAAENEALEGSVPEEQVKSEAIEMLNSLDSKFEMDHGKKLAIEEEVDQVYERIQDLEVDKEFLQHCMSSIEKGDKGVDVLQEILQHLRNLRTMDLHLRTVNDDQHGEVALEHQEEELQIS